MVWDNQPANSVDIWNMALDCIGENESIELETEERLSAEVCRRHYDNIVRRAFEAVPWPFAVKQATLSSPSGVTRTGWEYIYTLPTDCAIPLALLGEDQRVGLFTPDNRFPFDIQMSESGTWKVLCCDLAADDFEVLEYVAYSEYVLGYPAQLVDAIQYGLAAKLAFSVAKNPQLAGAMIQLRNQALSEARAQAFQTRQHDPEPITDSVAARGGNDSLYGRSRLRWP